MRDLHDLFLLGVIFLAGAAAVMAAWMVFG